MADEKQKGTSIVIAVGATPTPVAGEQGVSLAVNGNPIDVSSKDTAQWKEFLAGRSDWTVSGNGILMFDTGVNQLSDTQKEFWTAISTGVALDVEIRLTSVLIFSGSMIVTSFEPAADDDAAATLSWSGQGTGALTLTEGT